MGLTEILLAKLQHKLLFSKQLYHFSVKKRDYLTLLLLVPPLISIELIYLTLNTRFDFPPKQS